MDFGHWLKQNESSTMFHTAEFDPKRANLLGQLADAPFKFSIHGDKNLDIGLVDPRDRQDDVFHLDSEAKVIHLPSHYPLMNPLVVSKLEALGKSGKFDNWKLDGDGKGMSLKDLLSKVRVVSGRFPTYASQSNDHRSTQRRFAMRVIEEVWERDWYHATLKSYLPMIEKEGLKPGKRIKDIMKSKGSNSIAVGEIPVKGYASVNFDIQKAVYLYNNETSASYLARGLADKFGEASVVLKVRGIALKDYSKLLPDEDEFRDGSSLGRPFVKGVPHFLQSGMGQIKALAYAGIISPQYLQVIGEFEPSDSYDD